MHAERAAERLKGVLEAQRPVILSARSRERERERRGRGSRRRTNSLA
jgi:hypothetical protein